MKQTSKELVRAIGKLTKHEQDIVCQLYDDGNECKLSDLNGEQKYLTILHEGASKVEKIELRLPAGQYYEVEEDPQDSVFCPSD